MRFGRQRASLDVALRFDPGKKFFEKCSELAHTRRSCPAPHAGKIGQKLMSTEAFILLSLIVPALLAVLGLVFKLLYGLTRLERKLNEIAFELENLHSANEPGLNDSKAQV